MKILALADEPDARLWDGIDKESLKQADLILSAGDLPASYLSYLTVYTHAPIVYVPGNHDAAYEREPPEGCINADGQLLLIDGIRILGLGGSYRYKPGPCMYTEGEMRRRLHRLALPLAMKRGFDILLTHAPAKGLGDMDTTAHQGFACYVDLMEKYKPRLMVHGHVHKAYGANFVRERHYGDTRIVNACGKIMLEL